MSRVELTEAKAPLESYARRAQRGPVVLMRRGRPVALLRLLTDEEREDYLVARHPGFLDLISRSRQENPSGSGLPLDEVERRLGPVRSRLAPPRRRSR
jgi:antitoxin (DNA-binding transcriptional repressor) of toxin-antitoxin stability system